MFWLQFECAVNLQAYAVLGSQGPTPDGKVVVKVHIQAGDRGQDEGEYCIKHAG